MPAHVVDHARLSELAGVTYGVVVLTD